MSPRRTDTGGRIDRFAHASASPSTASRMTGHAGDTLASALLANGVSLFGRSFKYHRPRGVLTAGIDEPNALVTVLKGDVREPNIPATMLEIYDGLTVVSQNRFPSLAFDVGAVNQLAGKLLGGRLLLQDLHGAGDRAAERHALLDVLRKFHPPRRRPWPRRPREGPVALRAHERLLRRAGRGFRAGRADGGKGGCRSGAARHPRRTRCRASAARPTGRARRSTACRPPTGRRRRCEDLGRARQCPAAAAHDRLGLLRRQHARRARARHRPQGRAARASRATATGRSAPTRSCSPPAPSSGRWCSPATTGRA